MKRFKLLSLFMFGLCAVVVGCSSNSTQSTKTEDIQTRNQERRSQSTMDLGQFSICLTVKDIHASKDFYENIGFTKAGGNIDQNWLLLRNGDATIGLFQGMFAENLLTFNPGWSRDGNHPEEFTDIRAIQAQMKAAGIKLITEADETTTGPASLTFADPDGNMILFDQHR